MGRAKGRARLGERTGRDGKPLPYFHCYYDHKRAWRSRKAAEDVAAQLRRQDEEQVHIYWCVKAGAWHLSKSQRADYDRRQVMSNTGERTDAKMPKLDAAHPLLAARGTTLEPQHLTLACTCGEPIELDVSGDVRNMPAGNLDPAAELITVSVQVRHHQHNRVEGFGMYVVMPDGG